MKRFITILVAFLSFSVVTSLGQKVYAATVVDDSSYTITPSDVSTYDVRYLGDTVYPEIKVDVQSDVPVAGCVFVVEQPNGRVANLNTENVTDLGNEKYRCKLDTGGMDYQFNLEGYWIVHPNAYDEDFNKFEGNRQVVSVDLNRPTSSIKEVKKELFNGETVLDVFFEGTDGDGIGLEWFDLYYSYNNGPWQKLDNSCGRADLMVSNNIPYQFFDHLWTGAGTYRFYSIAIDYTGKYETKTATAEFTIEVSETEVRELEENSDITDEEGDSPINPVETGTENSGTSTNNSINENSGGETESSLAKDVITQEQDVWYISFSEESKIDSVSEFTIINNEWGKIEFSENINLSGEGVIEKINSIKDYVIFEKGVLIINSDEFPTLSDSKAKITFYNLEYEIQPLVLVNGEEDSEGLILGEEYDEEKGELMIEVSELQNFEIVESESDDIWDGIANTEYESLNVWTEETVYLVLGGSLFVSSLLAIAIFFGGKKLYNRVRIKRENKKELTKTQKKELKVDMEEEVEKEIEEELEETKENKSN